jgi:hypothetical protein
VAPNAYASPEGLSCEDGEAVPAARGTHRQPCRQQQTSAQLDSTEYEAIKHCAAWSARKHSAVKIVRPFQQQALQAAAGRAQAALQAAAKMLYFK